MRNYLSLYRPYKIAYLVTALGGAVLMVIGFGLSGISVGAFYVLPFLWILVCAYIFMNMTKRKISGLIEEMNACRVGDYIRSMEKIVRECRGEDVTKYAKLLLSTGYLNYGDNNKAGAVLASIDPNFSTSASGDVLALMYYSNCAAYFTRIGDIYQAKMNVNSIYYLKNSPQMSRGMTLTADHFMEVRMIGIDLETRNLDGLAPRIRKLFDEAVTRLEKVSHAFGLARVAGYTEDHENERFWLSYCAENGGDSYAGRQSRMMLGQKA
ncbi:MAG: hypothetical protein ACOYJO_02620 [Eubacterium sp.]